MTTENKLDDNRNYSHFFDCSAECLQFHADATIDRCKHNAIIIWHTYTLHNINSHFAF